MIKPRLYIGGPWGCPLPTRKRSIFIIGGQGYISPSRDLPAAKRLLSYLRDTYQRQ